MYQFSRAIYRELASDIRPLPGESAQRAHTAVLEACERTIERMATDRHYFKRPVSHAVQRRPRPTSRCGAQTRVWSVVACYLGCADEWLARQPIHGTTSTATPLAVPRDDPPGHAVPADAAAAQRLLPVASASRRDRGRGGARAGSVDSAPMTGTDTPRVGFIGLGIMGSRMAANLARAGFELTVWTRTAGKAEAWAEEHGGEAVATPAERRRARATS